MAAGAGIEPIRSRQTYSLLRRSGSRGRAGPVTVQFVEQTSWSRPQVAYALGRKLGGAVVRNRLRRRLRAVLREETAELPRGAYLVRVAPGGDELTYDQLRMAMGTALRSATKSRSGNGPTDALVTAGRRRP